MPLTKDTPIETYIHDFVNSTNPKFEGKSKHLRKKMAIAAYYSKHNNESADDIDVDAILKESEKQSEYVSNILQNIHNADPKVKAKHLKYLKGIMHKDDYDHIERTLNGTKNEAVEDENLCEALRSQKSYSEMSKYISHAPDTHFERSATQLIHHGLGGGDRAQDDYARHAALFDKRLSDKHLGDISSHVDKVGKTTNELDKNFHKNVKSVAAFRSAMSSDTPDTKSLKKTITSDHKNAIFAHGSDQEKAFVLKHGLATKTHLKSALSSESDSVREAAKTHLQSLKASGDTKHEDLYHHLTPDDKPEPKKGLFARIKDSFKQNLAKRMAATAQKPKKERIEPTFEDLIAAIDGKHMTEAREMVRTMLEAKRTAKLNELRQEVIVAKYNNITE